MFSSVYWRWTGRREIEVLEWISWVRPYFSPLCPIAGVMDSGLHDFIIEPTLRPPLNIRGGIGHTSGIDGLSVTADGSVPVRRHGEF